MIKNSWSFLYLALISIFPLTAGLPNTAANAEVQPQSSSELSSTLKVGETRSQSIARSQAKAIAKIHVHQIGEKSAATVYVRNLPVLTFIAANSINGKGLKVESSIKLPSSDGTTSSFSSSDLSSKDPVVRATAFSAIVNQLARDGFDASNINPVWQSQQYLVKFGTQAALKIDDSLLIPNTTKNKSQDTLQTANLLRWLMGNARPASAVSGEPVARVVPAKKLPINPVTIVSQIVSGMASWYGPGFHGNYSASGERFDQYKMTAAHPSLPFGTPVRVTNMDNGRSVVVRINDRGPFAYDRVIDLSRGAAQVLGLISSGVAPVRLEILRR